MTEPRWTPGPWSLGMVAVVIDGHYHDAPREAIIYCGPETQQDENEVRVEGPDARANACLIAAAPELYEALRDLLDTTGGSTGNTPSSRRAVAALAKARGAP